VRSNALQAGPGFQAIGGVLVPNTQFVEHLGNQRSAWENFGFAFGAILVNEMDGMDWVTVIDGKEEYPALRFAQTDVMVYPSRLIWNKVKNGQPCNLKAEYERIRSEVEAVL
jgi:DNA-binding LytR/AlgR family response regulator